MKKWLKFFGLSFFSDKISKQAVKHGYMNLFLGVILSLVFLFCGIIAADLLPFSAHYNNSSSFSAFVRNAVGGLDLQVVSGKISSLRIVDTFSVTDDMSEFGLNGYNLVVDTRSADVYDDFEAYYISNDGSGQEISLEEYETLSDVAKRNFDFKIRYTAKELVLTEELTALHEAYLTGANSEDFLKLQEKKGDLSADEYRKQVYNLYVKEYYPDLSAYENTGGAPLLRNYYYHNYVNAGAEKYLFIFDDSLVGSFETDAGMRTDFYGFYKGFPEGASFRTETDADAFIKNAFKSTASLSVYVYFINIFRLIPFIVLMPVIIALLSYCILRITKSESAGGFGGCIKIVGSYLWFGSLVSGLLTLIFGFLIPRSNILVAALLIFFATILIRTAVFLIAEAVRAKRAGVAENTQTEKENDT